MHRVRNLLLLVVHFLLNSVRGIYMNGTIFNPSVYFDDPFGADVFERC